MVDYNKMYVSLGSLSKLTGLGTVIYGIATQEMEIVAGGVALAYVGRTMTADCLEIEKNKIQERRNEILKTKSTLDNKIR